MSSSTVPMPPGTTTKASEARTKWCSRVKNVLCSKDLFDERVHVLLERQLYANPDRAVALRGLDRGRPFVGGLHETRAAARDDVTAHLGQSLRHAPDLRVHERPRLGREPKIVTR